MEVGVVVGNPKPASRTLAAAALLAELLADVPPEFVLDLAELGDEVLRWGSPRVEELISRVSQLDVVVFASPTYKATFTGLLKCFLDQIPADALRGVVGVPLMLGAGTGHQLAPEIGLKPVLVELGATCPTQGCYVVESGYDDRAAYEPWLSRWRKVIEALAR